ncbi:MAG: glycosyltransferase family 39 protein [Thermomicrobiales bacterium]
MIGEAPAGRIGPTHLRTLVTRDPLIAAVLFAFTLWLILPAVDETPFHRDEARWIYRVNLLREWSDPLGPRWQDEGYPIRYRSYDENYRMRGQPPFAGYVFGLGLLLQGRDATTNGYWIMDRDDAWNAARGHMPSAGDLRAARRTNVVIAGLTVVAVYFIGKRLTNRLGGVIGALALAVHPMLEDTATRAWSDPLLMLLIALAAVASYRLADRPTWPRAIMLGTLLGLGGATKLSPLLLALPLAGLGALFLVERWWRSRRGATLPGRRLGWMLLAVPLIAFVVFVAVYPFTWTSPINHSYDLFAFRADSFRRQAAAFPPAEVNGLPDAFRRVGDELGARFSATGRIVDEVEQHSGIGLPDAWRDNGFDLAVAVVGLELLVVLLARRGLRSAHALAAFVFGGQALMIIVSMGVEYARYLLPVLLLVVVCIGVVAGQGWIALRRLWATRDRLGRVARPSPRPISPRPALTEGIQIGPGNV